MQDYEKLGLFYLGRKFDLATGKRLDEPVLYESRDLVTHAVCVGMTGSGKTGLCLSLIEEAAIDGVPVIAIDPKGDLGNLLLTFPNLAPGDFRPWIDEDDARRAGVAPDACAAQQADAWKAGLADWGQDAARITRLRAAADFAIYTPGSRAGLPVSVLASFAAPPSAVRDDAEAMAERASATATSVLALAGVDAPPRSREHTLVATILSTAWKAGRDLDLPTLIQHVQSPPFQSVGVVGLDAFFPAKERFELAMQFNAVLAAPGFEQWFEGEPLDPATLLYTAEGRPRVVILSVAHLGDAERMFFVSLLLNQMVGWMRAQTGTSSLRAILYMDEIAGYFPPTANPPSKPPLLTLLKQARAFGLGVVLATQNPVDLDYKGLGNAGTWFLGRLQTERDKARMLDGLEGATAGALDRGQADRMLSALGKRVFLLHNVHEKAPFVFQTRWTLSYLRGPLSRDQIRTLMSGRAPGVPAPATGMAARSLAPVTAGASPAPAAATRAAAAAPPVLPPNVQQFYIPAQGPDASYTPVILGAARVGFSETKQGISVSRDVLYTTRITDGAVPVDWARSISLDLPVADLRREAEPGGAYEAVPPAVSQARSFAAWEKAFARWLAENERVELLRHKDSKLTSQPGESERDFRIRVQDSRRAARDEELDDVRKKYAPRQAALTERLRKAEAAVQREQEQSTQQRVQTALSFGATVLGAFLGRKAVSASTLGRATTAARGLGRSMKESSDVTRAAESVDAVRQQIQQLEQEMQEVTQAISAHYDAEPFFDKMALAPARGQVTVQFVAIGWDPRAIA